MRKSKRCPPLALLAVSLSALAVAAGCEQKVGQFVDVDRVLVQESEPLPHPIALPVPPKPMAARTFTLPGLPPGVLIASRKGATISPQGRAEVAQEKALKQLAQRLSAIYLRQADLFAGEISRAAGDPDKARLLEALPKLRQAFDSYAASRLPLITRLWLVAGFPDSNPTGRAPADSLPPVLKAQWLEANSIRTR